MFFRKRLSVWALNALPRPASSSTLARLSFWRLLCTAARTRSRSAWPLEDGPAAPPRPGLQSGHALGPVAPDPAVDGHHGAADLGGDLLGGQALGFEQDHAAAGAEGMALAVAGAFLQGAPLVVGQVENNQSAHRALIIAYLWTIST